MNHPLPWKLPLRNRYFVLRHGESIANQQQLIISSPEVGVSQFGLSETGREQVESSVRRDRDLLSQCRAIYASDFLRTQETAQLAATILSVDLQTTPLLRERFFGDWDGLSNQHYDSVWDADRRNATQTSGNVESVDAVARRMTQFIAALELRHSDADLLLVSHGDPLQILLTAAAGKDLREHRSLDPLMTAEIRPLP